MRIFWGAVLGTVLNLALFTFCTYLNGTPVPSIRTPVALLAYPMDSATGTLVTAGIIYFISLVITCILVPRKVR